MNKYLEKVAKRADLGWWAQALDNTSDDIFRHSGASGQEFVSRVSKPVKSNLYGRSEHGGVEVTRSRDGYLITALDGSSDVAGRRSPTLMVSSKRLTPHQADRFARHASVSRAKVETARGMPAGASLGSLDSARFKQDYAEALRKADSAYRKSMVKHVGKIGAIASIPVAGLGYLAHKHFNGQNND